MAPTIVLLMDGREAVLNDLVGAYARVRLLLGDHKLRGIHRPPKP
jgi:hypothetical protein